MKVVLLAGGYGSRLSEETSVLPKPLVEVGGKPIIWQVMKIYAYYGFTEFVVCLGYKGELIKDWFRNYKDNYSNLTYNLADGSVEYHKTHKEDWQVTLVDTGLHTMTGGRIKRIRKYVKGEQFMVNYSDGLGDVNLRKLLKHHEKKEKLGTITAAVPEGRFGALKIDGYDRVVGFEEKKDVQSWVNAGFMVFEPEIFDYIKDDRSVLERDVLPKLAKKKLLNSYKHKGFWKPMDKMYDKRILEKLWKQGKAPWKLWRG